MNQPGIFKSLWDRLRHPAAALVSAATFVLRHPVRSFLAAVLLVVGVVGLILPIMPGWVFIFAGLAVLGPNTRMAIWLKGLLGRLRGK